MASGVRDLSKVGNTGLVELTFFMYSRDLNNKHLNNELVQYSGDLKSRLVRILDGCKWSGFWSGIWNPEAQPFEIGTNGRHFVKTTIWNLDKWFGFQMVWSIAIGKVRKPNHLKSDFEKVWIWNGRISDPQCFQMSVFQAQVPKVPYSNYLPCCIPRQL